MFFRPNDHNFILLKVDIQDFIIIYEAKWGTDHLTWRRLEPMCLCQIILFKIHHYLCRKKTWEHNIFKFSCQNMFTQKVSILSLLWKNHSPFLVKWAVQSFLYHFWTAVKGWCYNKYWLITDIQKTYAMKIEYISKFILFSVN